MSRTAKRRGTYARRKARRRGGARWISRISPLVWIIGGSILFLALGVIFSLWHTGALAGPVEPSRSEQPEDLMPLAEGGSPLFGEHDMSLIPAQVPTPSAAPAGEPVPRMEIPYPRHSFGRIPSRQDVAHVFAVQNTGDDDLVISNLVTSCGCTTAELSSNVIGPGQRADLTVVFDPDYHFTRGEVTRVVWFATNDPTYPWAELRITADVVS